MSKLGRFAEIVTKFLLCACASEQQEKNVGTRIRRYTRPRAPWHASQILPNSRWSMQFWWFRAFLGDWDSRVLIPMLDFFFFFLFYLISSYSSHSSSSSFISGYFCFFLFFSSSSSSFRHQLFSSSSSNTISWPTTSFFSYASASNVTFFSIRCAFLRWHLQSGSISTAHTSVHSMHCHRPKYLAHTQTLTLAAISATTRAICIPRHFSAPSPLWLIREPLTWIWIYHKTNRFAIQLRPAFQWTSAAASLSTPSPFVPQCLEHFSLSPHTIALFISNANPPAHIISSIMIIVEFISILNDASMGSSSMFSGLKQHHYNNFSHPSKRVCVCVHKIKRPAESIDWRNGRNLGARTHTTTLSVYPSVPFASISPQAYGCWQCISSLHALNFPS